MQKRSTTETNDAYERSDAHPTTSQAYATPRLSVFGDLLQLTQQFGPGPQSDKGSNEMGASTVLLFGAFTDEPGSFGDE